MVGVIILVTFLPICLFVYTDYTESVDDLDLAFNRSEVSSNKEAFKIDYIESSFADDSLDNVSDGKNQLGDTGNGKSGILFGNYPGELFAISMTGEGSGAGEGLMGDGGKAYGLMQLDYRYALIPFCQWAYSAYPDVWSGLAPFQNVGRGDPVLKNNSQVLSAFEDARSRNPKDFVSSQCEFFKVTYFDGTSSALKKQGIDLDKRNIAVSAALLSIQVNAGSITKKVCAVLTNQMTDEEMIHVLYENRRNGNFASSGGSNQRWQKDGEEAQCMALLSGTWKIDQDYTAADQYSGGWYWSKLKSIYFE